MESKNEQLQDLISEDDSLLVNNEGRDIMKKVSVLFLSVIMVVSLSACGSITEKGPDPAEEIVGEWLWDTGLTTWHFIFEADGTCHYYSGSGGIDYSVYSINEDKQISIDNLDWDFYYEVVGDTFALYHLRENGDVKFEKNPDYVPLNLAFVELDKDIREEIEAEIEKNVTTNKEIFLLAQTLANRELGVTFTDITITTQKRVDPYTYIAYGVIYAEDNYGKKYKQNINIVYMAAKSEEEECGYKLQHKLTFVD